MLAKLLLLTAAIGAAAATPSPKNFMVPSLNSSNVHKILAAPKNSTICGKDLYSPYQVRRSSFPSAHGLAN